MLNTPFKKHQYNRIYGPHRNAMKDDLILQKASNILPAHKFVMRMILLSPKCWAYFTFEYYKG